MVLLLVALVTNCTLISFLLAGVGRLVASRLLLLLLLSTVLLLPLLLLSRGSVLLLFLTVLLCSPTSLLLLLLLFANVVTSAGVVQLEPGWDILTCVPSDFSFLLFSQTF